MNKKNVLVLVFFCLFFPLVLPSISFSSDLQETREYLTNNAVCAKDPSNFPAGTFCNPSVKKDEKDITDNDLIQAILRTSKGPDVDVKMKIVQKITDVRLGKITPEDFYKQVSAMEMPEGKEVRHVLMEVKKDIGNYLGETGLRRVFGDLYPSGGSVAESKILMHRKQVVMETIDQVIKDFADSDLKFTVYYSEVGGWPNEGPKDMKFAGDIDFNFLCGDLETAMKLKKAYDAYIVKRYGRTPEDLDIPCTVHGMATGEVYVGKKGQSFAERVTKTARKIIFNEDGKGVRLSEPIAFQRALGNMLAEAEISKIPLANLEQLKWPTEPGISLEMIRHFEHDIAGQNVYTTLESFVKGAKYTDRSFTALENDKGPEAIKDKVFRDLTAELVAQKKNPKKQVEAIKQFYEMHHMELPYDARLETSAEGHSKATLELNEKLVKEFWDECRKVMWETANTKLRKVIDDFKKKARSMKRLNPEEVKILYEKLNKYNEMVEVEDRVLTDKKAGLHDKMNSEYQKLVGEFRDVVKDFKQQVAKNDYLKVIDPAKSDAYKFIDEQLKLDNKHSVRLAAAAMLEFPGKVNDVLDFFDDNLMNNLRYGDTKTYKDFLQSGEKAFWNDQADYFMGAVDISKYPAHTRQSKLKMTALSKELDFELNKSLKARGLKMVRGVKNTVSGGMQRVNNTFQQSVANSTGGQAMMHGMMIYNLSQEIPVYINLVAKGDYEGLAAEFFKRRVPFGGAVERAVMGDYYGVAWEVTSTVIPPVAMFSAAASLGESLGETTWDTYWDEELESFIDNLYDKAKFEAVGVETTGDNIKISQWELIEVTYRGETYNINDLIQMETEGAREMGKCLQLPSEQRAECFPMEKVNDGLFQWWQTSTAFEEKFQKTDPWIQLITEMEKAPHVGKKLKDHFYYQKETRWEQIKAEFLQHLKEKLEDRRAGEQTLLSGSFLKTYEELLLISGKLDIRPQVEKALDDEFGGAVTEAIDYVKDLLRGVVREINDDVDIWDRYEEIATYVTAAARTYKRIWDVRAEAEKGIPVSRNDQGLRLLTGPYFLSGIYSDDAPSEKKWVEYPTQAKDKMVEALLDIKLRSESEDTHLNLEEGEYDKNMLDKLIFHDVFAEMWQQVNSSMTDVEIPSYLGSEESQQSNPNPEGGQSDQDRSLERFKFHKEKIDELLDEFRNHYGVEKEDELTALRELRDQAVALSAEICSDCASATTSMSTVAEKSDSVQESITEFENKIKEAIKTLKELDSTKSDLENEHATAESLATSIGDAAVLAKKDRETVCKIADSMKNCKTNGERDQLYSQASSASAEARSAFNSSRGEFKELEGMGNSAKEKLDKLQKAQKTAQDITEIPEEIATANNDVKTGIQQAEGLIQGAEGKLADLKTIYSNAKSAANDAKRALKPKRKTEAGKTLLAEIKSILGEISAQVKSAAACIKGPKKEQKTAKTQADKFSEHYTGLQNDLDKIHKAFLPDSEGNNPEIFGIALEKANLIDLLASMGKGYIKRCTEHMLMAKVCMNQVDQLSAIDFSAVMPNVVGMSCQDGSGAVGSNNINYQVVSKGKATHPDWEYRVESTDPPGGVEVTLAETTAVISCYEDLDIPAYLATVDCSHVPGSTAVYNPGARKAFCDCVNGLVFNAARSQCINCDQYYQGFAGAFNAGNLDAAQGVVNDAKRCTDWVGDAQTTINEIRRWQKCEELDAQMAFLAQQVPRIDIGQVNSVYAQAKELGCQLSTATLQIANAAADRQAEADRIRFQQEQEAADRRHQQQMQNQQDLMNMWGQTIQQIQQMQNPYNPPTTRQNPNPGRDQATTQMTGRCNGTLSANPIAGKHGTPSTITVQIAYPESQYVKRVSSDNPACHDCDLSKSGQSSWKRTFYFQGSGTFTLRFIAYDNQGREMCRGTIHPRVLPSK